MKLSFQAGKHKFKCVQCGKCCYPTALSLTPEDKRSLLTTGDLPGLRGNPNPPFSHELVCEGKCRFLTADTLCSVWEKRPAVCVAFPLAFTYNPEGEMLVNYMACEGQDAPDGEVVDQAFVEKTVQEIKSRNPYFFDELMARKVAEHQLLFPFYTERELTEFHAKQSAKEGLATMLTEVLADSTEFRASIYAFLQSASSVFESEVDSLPRRGRKVVLFDDQVTRIMEKVSEQVKNTHHTTCDALVKAIDTNEKQAAESGRCQIFWDGAPKEVELTEFLETNSLTGERMTAKASSVFFRRHFSRGAMTRILEHLSECLVRVDLGGFPIDAEISVMLKSLGDYSKSLETFCYLYSPDDASVSELTATKVVQDLDTFFVLGSSYAENLGAGLL